jgi:hypothetical protein
MYSVDFSAVGIKIPEILLPKTLDEVWPVIACDQFTQDRDYWQRVKEIVNGRPSTLDFIFPEVFLEDADAPMKINAVHRAMESHYGIFREAVKGFIYIERDTPYQKKRRGLIAAIDLEQYDWEPQARPSIRSTEATVTERLPPRMNIRRNALLELPHAILLIDDDANCLLPNLGERVCKNAPLYTTNLMMDSGSVTGWLVDLPEDLSFIQNTLDTLKNRSINRYAGQPFLFAVGDGNHSLAAAKAVWEECELPDHPCRYALVEIENIYDEAVHFEPIHRLLFDLTFDDALSLLSKLPGFKASMRFSPEELLGNFGLVSRDRYALIETSAKGNACLQPLLDSYPSLNIDYIHDDDELLRLSKDAVGILLPPPDKTGLFETIARSGPLPRKSFSLGRACEKRFYLECRRIIT